MEKRVAVEKLISENESLRRKVKVQQEDIDYLRNENEALKSSIKKGGKILEPAESEVEK